MDLKTRIVIFAYLKNLKAPIQTHFLKHYLSTWYSKREYTFDAIGVSITAFMMFIGALILLKENVFVAILSFGLSVICGLSAYFIFKDRDS